MAAIFEQKIWRRHRLCAHLDSMTRWTRLSLQLHSAASYSLPTILPSLLLFTVFKIVFFSFTFSLILICSFLGNRSLRFVEKCSFEYGSILHALAAAMRSLLTEYHLMIAQLETLFNTVL